MENNDNSLLWIIGGAVLCILIPPLGVLVMSVAVFLLVSSFFVDQNK